MKIIITTMLIIKTTMMNTTMNTTSIIEINDNDGDHHLCCSRPERQYLRPSAFHPHVHVDQHTNLSVMYPLDAQNDSEY